MEKRKHKKVNQGPDPMSFWVSRLNAEKTRRKKGGNNKGFSLVELIIVIAIMAILAAAIAPALIRYIDKSRKAVDVASAEVLYKAAEMAATTGSDVAAAGWERVAERTDSAVAYTKVTAAGHNIKFEAGATDTYHITCMAWARGVNYNQGSGIQWQNALFKCTLDNDKDGDIARAYTNEFLACLLHEDAKDEIYSANVNNKFNGHSAQTVEMKFKKDAGMGQPECWMICIRTDNYTPEIWIGDKNFNGRGTGQLVRPIYRIYPNPCEEYKQ